MVHTDCTTAIIVQHLKDILVFHHGDLEVNSRNTANMLQSNLPELHLIWKSKAFKNDITCVTETAD